MQKYLRLQEKNSMSAVIESAGGIIMNDKGEIVIAKQSNIHIPWSFPKGHVEVGEDFLIAAKREIQEESGITELELIRELPVYERPITAKDGTDSQDIKRFHYFLFKTSQTELNPTDPSNPEARWVPKSEVLDYLRHPKDKEFFVRILPEIP